MDGGDPLIAHSISLPTCARRQRERYHKCYTCLHALGGTAVPPAKRVQSPESSPPATITSEGVA